MEILRYTRVACQDVGHDALDRQRQTIDDRARETGCMIAESVEEVHGGMTMGPLLEMVILRAEAGEVTEVHVSSVDRVSRNPHVVREVLARLDAAGAKLVTDIPSDLLEHWLAVFSDADESQSQMIRRALRARRDGRG